MEVTRVHRPCRTMSTQLLMLGILLVNGAATLASPILTMGNSSISKSSSCPAIVAAEPATVCFDAMAAFFFFASVFSAETNSCSALTCAQATPSSSNSFTRAAILSCFSCMSSRCFSLPSAFFFLRSSTFFCFSYFLIATSRPLISHSWMRSSLFPANSGYLLRSTPSARIFALIIQIGPRRTEARSCGDRTVNLEVSTVMAPFFTGFFLLPSSPLSTFTSPNPDRSATPTSACFNAPTSLAPSPHIRHNIPTEWRHSMTVSLASGVMRAKTLKCARIVFVSLSYS
mmetsp:Transcript_29064/g.60528  ORF Transcript_29064/g.60528 Transcript_29064/m.60528 type:complete len:286 (-) Transcript_29064:1991-2848(-)